MIYLHFVYFFIAWCNKAVHCNHATNNFLFSFIPPISKIIVKFEIEYLHKFLKWNFFFYLENCKIFEIEYLQILKPCAKYSNISYDHIKGPSRAEYTGTVPGDFWPLFFSSIKFTWAPEQQVNIFNFSKTRSQIFRTYNSNTFNLIFTEIENILPLVQNLETLSPLKGNFKRNPVAVQSVGYIVLLWMKFSPCIL